MVFSPLVCLTSRSQYPRLKTVIQSLEFDDDVDLTVVVSGGALTHDYGDITKILEEDGIEIDITHHNLLEGDAPANQGKTTGLAMIEFSTVLAREQPDVVLLTGDRYETMAMTIASSYQNIPVCHFEGGEITGSIDDKVRHATTKMADYHFVSTAKAMEILLELGEEITRISHTGCPSIDVARKIEDNRPEDYDPQTEVSGVGAHIDTSAEYIVVQYHPMPTEYESNEEMTWEVIDAVESLDVQTFWFWPNMDSGNDQVSSALRNYRESYDPDDVKFYINLPPEDYLTLVRNSECLVGNSSVGIRECSYFGTPSVNIGSRQQFRERANNVMDVSCNATDIAAAIQSQIEHGRYQTSALYGDGHATETITELLKNTVHEPKGSMNPELLDESLATNLE